MFNEKPQFNEIRKMENGRTGRAFPAIVIEGNKFYYVPKNNLNREPTHIRRYRGLLRFFFSPNCNEDYKSFIKIPNGASSFCFPDFKTGDAGHNYGDIEWV